MFWNGQKTNLDALTTEPSPNTTSYSSTVSWYSPTWFYWSVGFQKKCNIKSWLSTLVIFFQIWWVNHTFLERKKWNINININIQNRLLCGYMWSSRPQRQAHPRLHLAKKSFEVIWKSVNLLNDKTVDLQFPGNEWKIQPAISRVTANVKPRGTKYRVISPTWMFND